MNNVKIIDFLKRPFKNSFNWSDRSTEDSWVNISTGEGYQLGDWRNPTDSPEITYFICLKVLAETMGKLTIHLKDEDNKKLSQSDVNYLLKVRPNAFMSPSDFKSLMEFNRNHYGNAYAYIETDKTGKRVGLHPLDPRNVKIILDDINMLKSDVSYIYKYEEKGKVYYFLDKEIIHLKGGLTRDGIVGKSIAEELAGTIEGSKKADKYLSNLYGRGLTANAILQYTGDLSDTAKEKLLKKLHDFAKSEDQGNIIPIPLGMDLRPLDIKLTDAQFLELKEFTSLQIAAAFGIKPNHLNNYAKSSYANSESQNLAFLVDTLLSIVKKWEEEIDYKLLFEDELKKGIHTEFNVKTILRGDIKTQAEALRSYVTSGIYSVNEARMYLGDPIIDDGDVNMINGTYVKLDDIGKAYERKGGEGSD